MNPDLALALELADLADGITLSRFRSPHLVVEAKPDRTPVTEADRVAEEAMRARLVRHRPGHAILGEERGPTAGAGAWRWVLDPLDGTKNYVRGIPVFATLIALEHDGRTVLGVVSAPALGRRWWAARGEGAFADGEPIRVSPVARLDEALLSYDEPLAFGPERNGPFLALARRCARVRGYGDFWAHTLVAEGAVDAAVYAEPGLRRWDVAPLEVIVEEAGGRFTDLSGGQWTEGGSALSSNALLHEELVAALGASNPPPSAGH